MSQQLPEANNAAQEIGGECGGDAEAPRRIEGLAWRDAYDLNVGRWVELEKQPLRTSTGTVCKDWTNLMDVRQCIFIDAST